MLNSTFGIEFESNLIDRQGRINDFSMYSIPLNSGWHRQDDPTTAIEINSPIYRTINQAVRSISRQFEKFAQHFNCVFYAYNANNFVSEHLTSSGQHIHVGIDPRENRTLEFNTKQLAVLHIRKIYPLLMAISAQPIPSERMLHSSYCSSLSYNDNCMPYGRNDHSQEINFSHRGTVEFRVFDTNIPQCSLTEAWFLTKIMNHARKKPSLNEHFEIGNFNKDIYANLRNLACTHGFASLPLTQMLTEISQMIQNEDINSFETNAIREILYLMAKYALNPSDVYHILKPNKYNYFRVMFQKPNEYLNNLKEIITNTHIEQWIQKLQSKIKNITNFQQLIELSKETVKNPFETDKTQQQKLPVEQKPTTEQIKQLIAKNKHTIKRIIEYEEFTTNEIAEKISQILQNASRRYVNHLNAQQILEANERFYALTVPFKGKTYILGTVALRMSNGRISHLVVNKDYRRLGIATELLRYVVNFAMETAFNDLTVFVRRENDISEKLFQKFGFEITDESENKLSNRFELKINASETV